MILCAYESTAAWAQDGNGGAEDAPLSLDAIEITDTAVPEGESFDERLAHVAAERVEPGESVVDAVSRMTSVQPQRRGSALQRTSMAFRGAAAQDIAVRYRGVSINSVSDASADLSLIPGRLVSTARLSAGGAAAATGGVGGVLDLGAESSPGHAAAVSGTTLGDFSLFGRGFARFGDIRVGGAVFGDRSPGEFDYVDDQGVLRWRRHNAASRVGAQVEADADLGAARLAAYSLYSRIDRQEAGLSEFPSRYRDAEQHVWLSLSRAEAEFAPIGAGAAQFVGRVWASHRAAGDVYDNPTAYVGGRPTHTDYLENQTSVRGGGDFVTGTWGVTSIEAGYEARLVRAEHLVYGSTQTLEHAGHLIFVQAAESVSLWDDRLRAALTLHGEWIVGSDPIANGHLGIAARPWDWLELWGSAAVASRYPSDNEKYYRTESIRGAEDLHPQHGYLAEAGIAGSYGDAVRVSVAGFYHYYTEIIRFVPITPYLYQAQNLTDVTSRGLEVTARATFWRGLGLDARYSLVDATTDAGNPMPTNARHNLLAILRWDDPVWEARAALSYRSRIPLNMSGTAFLPPRWNLDASVRFRFWPGWSLVFEIRNLLNDRESEDLLQQPLPGRRAALSLEWEG